MRTMDRRSASHPPGMQGSIRKPERVSEYFEPENGDRMVRRFELQAILHALESGRAEARWHRRLWRAMQRYFVRSARKGAE